MESKKKKEKKTLQEIKPKTFKNDTEDKKNLFTEHLYLRIYSILFKSI